MTTDRSTEPGDLEQGSSSPSFSIGQFFRMWMLLAEEIAEQYPNAIDDPSVARLRWVLTGHTGVTPDLGDPRLFDDVSPGSSFLVENLPLVLPSPAHEAPSRAAAAGPSTSTPTRATRSLPVPVACSSSADQGVQAPDAVVCPVHGLVHAICPTHGLTTVRVAPLRTLAPTGYGLDDESFSADSVDGSDASVSMTPSLADSLLSTPEHLNVSLPDAITPAAAAPAVAAPVPAVAAPVPAAPVVVVTPVPAVAPAPGPTAAQAAAGTPYVPHFDDDSGATNWYVVTCGRRVGVFDAWATMVSYVAHVSGGTGRGGFSSRAEAINAFRAAEAIGIVKQVG